MLSLLLDENVAPRVAEQLQAKAQDIRVASVHHWHEGAFVHAGDEVILEAARRENATLVTYDLSTIPTILKDWGEQGRSHGGAIFVDETSIRQNDYGGQVRALLDIWKRLRDADLTDAVLFLQGIRER